jgi:hypothetical protein
MALAHPLPLLASDATFFVLFGIFVVALVVLIVLTLAWTFRRDRAGRAAWRERQLSQTLAAPDHEPPISPPSAPPPSPSAPQ